MLQDAGGTTSHPSCRGLWGGQEVRAQYTGGLSRKEPSSLSKSFTALIGNLRLRESK